ncbi:hypothetical protein EG329_009947 [Mollisiaceae sp. DMI_Dod_QoI]|nr:hypothetical protein EG329_009947 [Helotiales sp. DMI_Dod_QoI]
MSNEPKAIYLLPTEGDGFDSYKTTNPSSQISRPLIANYKKSQALRFRASLVGVIHGTLSTGGAPASLIVTEFRFESGDAARRFKSATIEYIFLSEDETSDKLRPEICRIAPSGAFSIDPLDTSAPTAVTSVESPSSPGPPPRMARRESIDSMATIKHAPRVHWKLNETQDAREHATLTGLTRTREDYGGKNIATWVLRENRSTMSGIPTVLQTAVLLKRRNNDDFMATLNIQAEVDLKYSMSTALKNVAGLVPRNNPIYFKVDQPLMGNLGGIDKDRLHDVKLGDHMSVVSIKR